MEIHPAIYFCLILGAFAWISGYWAQRKHGKANVLPASMMHKYRRVPVPGLLALAFGKPYADASITLPTACWQLYGIACVLTSIMLVVFGATTLAQYNVSSAVVTLGAIVTAAIHELLLRINSRRS